VLGYDFPTYACHPRLKAQSADDLLQQHVLPLRDYHYLSRFEIDSAKRLSRHMWKLKKRKPSSVNQSTLGALLGWLFSISLAMLGLSSIVAFQKMAHEAKGMGKLRFAFGAGICCPLVVLLI
jgi:hypothetical protein